MTSGARAIVASAARHAPPSLHAQVVAEQRALQWRARVADVAVALAAASLVLALSSALLAGGRWIVWPRALPVVFWATALGAALLAVRWYMHRRPARVTLPDVVTDIEREWALRDGALRGAMELQRSTDDGAAADSTDSAALREHAVEHVRRELLARAGASLTEPAVLAPKRRAGLQRRAGQMLAVAVGLVVAMVLVGRSASDGFAAMVHPISAWRGTLLPAITFGNLPADVARGRPLRAMVRAPLRTAVRVTVQRDGAPTDRRTVVLREGLGALDLGVMTSDVRLRVDDRRSPPIDTVVRVIDRPWVGDVRIDAEYPAYLGRANETLDLSAPIRVPKGTALTVHAVAHAGAHDVQLVAVDATVPSASAGSASRSPAVPFASVAGYGESARLLVMRTQRYSWRAAGTGGNTMDAVADVPEPIDITVIDDALPIVQLATDLESDLISPSMTAAFTVRVDDDHGVADVALQFRRVRGAGDAVTSIVRDVWGVRVPDPRLSVVQELARSFDVLALEPGDRVTVVAIARDASPWRQRGESSVLELRVPTAAEQRDLARALSDSLVRRASALSAAERALAAQTGNAARSRELNSAARPSSDASRTTNASSPAANASSAANMSQASADQMKALAQQQRQLGDRVDALRNDTEALQQRLADAGAMDAQMAQQFRELQQLLRDAMTPEMMEQLAALEKSADRLSGSEVKQSLEQLLARQQQMREQLERSAELLKRAALEGAMETLRDDAQELADAQRNAAKQLGDGEPVPPRDVQSLADRSARVADAVEQLADRLRRDGATAGATRASEAKRSADAASESMQQAARNAPARTAPNANPNSASTASANAAKNAASSAEQAAASMQEAAEQLRAARDEQIAAWKQDLASELDQAINETAQLARQQAELANRSQQRGQPGGQQAGQSAGQQQGGQPGAQSGAQPGGAQGGQQGAGDMRSAQSALQQGVQQAAARLEQAARGSSLLSQRSQRAMAEAQQKVQQATQAATQAAAQTTAQAGGSTAGAGRAGGSEQMEGAMRDASAALNQALASLVRDRERVNTASSASGFQEMMEQMKELAEQQNAVNSQMQGLAMMPGGAQGQAAQQQARMLARQQRNVAEGLQEVADVDPSGRLEALAQEAEQVAQSVARTGVADAAALARQQQLYRRMLDAGRMLEQEERDDRGEREAQAGDGRGTTVRGGTQTGRAAQRFTPPAWTDLRTLTAEERRAVSEYFRRLNGRDP